MAWNSKSLEPDIVDGHMLVHPGRGDPRKQESGSFFFALSDTSLSGWGNYRNCQGLKNTSLVSHNLYILRWGHSHFCRLVSTLNQQLRPRPSRPSGPSRSSRSSRPSRPSRSSRSSRTKLNCDHLLILGRLPHSISSFHLQKKSIFPDCFIFPIWCPWFKIVLNQRGWDKYSTLIFSRTLRCQLWSITCHKNKS